MVLWTALALQFLLQSKDLSAMEPRTEIVLVSLLHGVNPHLALAVAEVESGGLPESQRDRAYYRGNYGRFQINCTTWKGVFGLKDCTELFDRHLNIRAGVAILAHVQAVHGSRRGQPYWVAHYNEGWQLQEDGPGVRYARRVVALLRRMERRAYSAWRGW